MILTETTFRQAIKRPKLTFVKFYAPWYVFNVNHAMR